MPRTAILGGAGFIGSHLCDLFLERGHEVIAVDNLVTGFRRNVDHLKSKRAFSLLEHDICNPIPISGPLDFILNFASPASPPAFKPLALEILRVGSEGQRNALELACAKGARILFASTSEVYGDPAVSPLPETYLGNVNTIGIRGVYDEAKRFAEALTMAYHRRKGLATRLVRIFNTYGPRMDPNDGRVLPNFISQALRGEPLTIYGDGSQTRSFTYISDLIDGVWRLLHSEHVEPINIGSTDEIPVRRIAQEVIEEIGGRSDLTFHPLPEGDPLQRRPDITRARTKLGWEPKVSRREGLRLTIGYFREALSIGAAR